MHTIYSPGNKRSLICSMHKHCLLELTWSRRERKKSTKTSQYLSVNRYSRNQMKCVDCFVAWKLEIVVIISIESIYISVEVLSLSFTIWCALMCTSAPLVFFCIFQYLLVTTGFLVLHAIQIGLQFSLGLEMSANRRPFARALHLGSVNLHPFCNDKMTKG